MTTTPAPRGPLAGYRRKLGSETFAGMVLLGGAVVALAWANSPWRETYAALSAVTIGPESLGLSLSLSTWAADGLLALFFFVVGLELKNEFVNGSLHNLRRAAVPVIAAVCGMLGPAAVYLLVQWVSGAQVWQGWAIPVATDIAFAVALLGIFGRSFPPALRTFLLTLAVVDDLLGITIIAVAFTDHVSILLLLASLATIAVFALLLRARIMHWWVLVPLAVLAWALMHAAGVHATVAGVLLGLVVPATTRPQEAMPLVDRFASRIDWISAGFVLPIFAFFAAGINIVDAGGLGSVLTDPVSVGVSLALPLGKFIGIWGGTALLVAFTPLLLGDGLRLRDLPGMTLLAGVGFTVSLLIAQLSFDPTAVEGEHARIGVILGSVLAAALGAIVLKATGRRHASRSM
ncbi:Na+/H+ antiporter NhaA [Pseudactinotalea sp. HY158]|uniref:Na+/H+ antiporter NhaA n=1 Tax=Pseudactinotalea sp. HY158 TaxID=2654547 RepID=UPI00129C525C|nr:Na+/H+ antiporter NhaA [Pseudactinotalea sp. HY158]QGH69498.1 Na+/H+ antiporter NhaA [Pseudactinotalea sp. HY158]